MAYGIVTSLLLALFVPPEQDVIALDATARVDPARWGSG